MSQRAVKHHDTGVLIVDMQRDFVEGGALACAGGRALVAPIFRLLDAQPNALVIASRDWHPRDHISFVTNGGKWPVHCVQATRGAEVLPELDARADAHIYKGFFRMQEAYSAFDGFDSPVPGKGQSLQQILKSAAVKTIYVCGIALDYCVKATARDAVKLGYHTLLVTNATVGVASDSSDAALKALLAAGVETYQVS
jgi:nicotinamidase/pyrazinamidase